MKMKRFLSSNIINVSVVQFLLTPGIGSKLRALADSMLSSYAKHFAVLLSTTQPKFRDVRVFVRYTGRWALGRLYLLSK